MSATPEALLLSSNPDSTDLLSQQSGPQWAIYNTGSSDAAIEPDSFLDIDFRGEARTSDYPVEKGAFADYNKVQVPEEIRVRLACSNDQMSRGDFLTQLESMKQSTNLYDIATPDQFYISYTLTHYDYTRKSTNGVSLIVAECWFEEVRQTGSASYSTNGTSSVQSNSPSANDPQNSGTVSPDELQPSQQAAVGNPPVVQ